MPATDSGGTRVADVPPRQHHASLPFGGPPGADARQFVAPPSLLSETFPAHERQARASLESIGALADFLNTVDRKGTAWAYGVAADGATRGPLSAMLTETAQAALSAPSWRSDLGRDMREAYASRSASHATETGRSGAQVPASLCLGGIALSTQRAIDRGTSLAELCMVRMRIAAAVPSAILTPFASRDSGN